MGKKKADKKVKQKTQTPKVVPYPQAGKRVTDFENELDRQIETGEQTDQQTKRGPGRPRKEVQPAADIDIGPQLQLIVIDRMLRIPFSAWAEFANLSELKLTDREAADLAAATKELLDYYIPNLPPVLIMWSNFAIAAAVVLQPRFAKIKELKKQKLEKQATQTDQEGSQPAGQGRPVTPVKFPFPSEIKIEKL
jgi:hypothetical protein